jgi:signal transduction histidine kinase/ActR/RegA family two-component response regulator
MTVLFINMVCFGWIALLNPDTPEISCLFLFSALLNTIVTSRRCTPAFLAGAIPIFALLAGVQCEAYIAGVPHRRLILIGLAMLIAAGFCTVVWNGYSKSLSQAMEAATAKSAFLANMSHELRTPLNGVVAMASALQRTELSSAQHDMLGIIKVSAESLQILLSDILDLAKIEAGRIDLQSEPLAPAALARHVGALFREPSREKGLTFEIEADAPSQLLVLGDSVRLTQVLTNFCSNAVKFTAAGGVKLSVRSVQTGHVMSVRFDVTDSGIGMSADAKARIFERFSQGDGSITRRFGGTGLGLAISKQLVDLMGGRILVESHEGTGSTFSLLMEAPLVDTMGPAQSSDNDAGVETFDPAPAPPFETSSSADLPRLLLVEDHPTNRQVIQIILGDLMTLDMACDGAQGLEAVQRSSYNLILMDMQMPVMDGLSATRAIRQFERAAGRPRTPILMLSANALPEHVEAAAQAGADGHLSKPVTADKLLDAIDSTLADNASGAAPIADEPTA